MSGLKALKKANFDWVMRLDDVWRDVPYDVPEFNAAIRKGIIEKALKIGESSPLGWVILGPAGAGKTHLLSSLRHDALENRMTFILGDMTDVKDFRETLLLGFLSSLREPEALPQCRLIIKDILSLLGLNDEKAHRYAIALSKVPRQNLVDNTNKVIQALAPRYKKQMIEHQDILRALFLLNSEDFLLGGIGYNYLLGIELEHAEAAGVGIRRLKQEPIKLLKGLTWIAGLRGPTILALDQLDAIVNEYHIASSSTGDNQTSEDHLAAKAIIENLGRGLSALADHTTRTMCVVSCLETTWNILTRTALKSSTDRYEAPRLLQPLTSIETLNDIVSRRLALSFSESSFKPPYQTWPFKPSCLGQAAGLTPREILKRCDMHRRNCIDSGHVYELSTFEDLALNGEPVKERDEFVRLDNSFEALKKKTFTPSLLAEDYEDSLGDIFQTACRLLIREAPLPDDIDVLLETRFGGGKNFKPLHVRTSLIFSLKGGEETHICIRVLQKTNANAFITRLASAITASGIDDKIGFRRLFIIRNNPLPKGPKSKEIIGSFKKSGGRFLVPGEDDLRALWALKQLEKQSPPYFEEWLCTRQPLSTRPLFRQMFPELAGPDSIRLRQTPKKFIADEKRDPAAEVAISPRLDIRSAGARLLNIGTSLDSDSVKPGIDLPLSSLLKHTAILSSEGSGATLLLRNLLENCVLAGMPATVVDPGGVLINLGESWPAQPEGWTADHDARAADYLRTLELKIWTPGLEDGAPLPLPPLPDFRILTPTAPDYSDLLEDLVVMSQSVLSGYLAGKRSGKIKKMNSLLGSALHHFAVRGGGDTADFLMLLNDLPPEAGNGMRGAAKLALETAALIRSGIENDPLVDLDSADINVRRMLFEPLDDKKTRVSVISLQGLPELEDKRRFITLLNTALYSSLRSTQAGNGSITGLFALRQAEDYLPAGKTPACKAALLRLSGIGRRYGLGMLLSTKNPKELDSSTIMHFANWFFGKMNSPAAIRAARTVLNARGGEGRDVTGLERGQFFISAAGRISPPAKTGVPISLSSHTDKTYTDQELIARCRE